MNQGLWVKKLADCILTAKVLDFPFIISNSINIRTMHDITILSLQ